MPCLKPCTLSVHIYTDSTAGPAQPVNILVDTAVLSYTHTYIHTCMHDCAVVVVPLLLCRCCCVVPPGLLRVTYMHTYIHTGQSHCQAAFQGHTTRRGSDSHVQRHAPTSASAPRFRHKRTNAKMTNRFVEYGQTLPCDGWHRAVAQGCMAVSIPQAVAHRCNGGCPSINARRRRMIYGPAALL